MSSRIIQNKKWKDIYNIKEIEVKIALIITVILLSSAVFLDFHHEFITIQDDIKTIITIFLGGLLAMLGFVLAGIAIVISLFDKKMISFLQRIKKENAILQILVSFEFSAFFVAITILFLTGLYIVISLSEPVLGKVLFYVIFSVSIYSVLFNIFYIIALIGNCIRIYQLSIQFNEIDYLERSLIDEVNEIRIDYILNSIGNMSGTSRENLKESIVEFTKCSNNKSKDSIIKYLEKYYG